MSLFTKKDLGLLLPDDTPGDPVSLRHTNTKEITEEFKPLKPKVDLSKKVARYRAGHVPKFANGHEDECGFVTAKSKVQLDPATKVEHKLAPHGVNRRKRVEAQILIGGGSSANDSVSRVQYDISPAANKNSDVTDVTKALQDSSSDEENDSDIDRRRRMLREKIKARESRKDEVIGFSEKISLQLIEPKIVKRSVIFTSTEKPRNSDLASSNDSSSSEYETDTDESELGQELMKPVFVPKKARENMKRQEELAAEKERREKREQEKLEARKRESRRLVAEEIRREQTGIECEAPTDAEMPDDTDGLDPAQEYRDWELREMRRIKRDHDCKEWRRKEEEETLRRRNMTREEREAENAKLKNEPKEKKKLKFMQRYYHKGAFYVDDDSIRSKDDVRKRDASDATLEDKFDKEMLPAVMQVKNFGRAGRTKYTHLADQDTSSRDSLWARNDDIREKYKSHLGGMKNIDVSTKRRRKE
ncbi:Microfibrillar-associated protein MFAP1 [Plasmopara halstedii]|uniref:Microfibrillar-associated protein MFAP1 n=1 Tax=Plasmopara halstedii TaxID=4781 RepID=A0A0P1AFA6_PLAHL|nr:Microfibrillar-associated protein MFAP1 [Plasmopara halstedii]CEG39637.1 Microfibrillar-associated protein MFAP1 [Plasmopara halstedii]|eukprot:XP_024576006.1 Microfibrillar-associated protein MFAP1 [Plasmopara halstedii]